MVSNSFLQKLFGKAQKKDVLENRQSEDLINKMQEACALVQAETLPFLTAKDGDSDPLWKDFVRAVEKFSKAYTRFVDSEPIFKREKKMEAFQQIKAMIGKDVFAPLNQASGNKTQARAQRTTLKTKLNALTRDITRISQDLAA